MSDPKRKRALPILDGRERVPLRDAAQCLGWAPDRDPEWLRDSLTRKGVPVAEDGTCLAGDVLRALSAGRRRAETTAARQEPIWLPLRIERTGPAAWDMVLGGARPSRIGSLECVAAIEEPLARPAPILGVWVAAWPPVPGDPDPSWWETWAISAAAAQVLVLQRLPHVVLPDWADQVRELPLEMALAAQAIAEGRTPVAHGLTDWEVAQIKPIRNQIARVYANDIAILGLDTAQDRLQNAASRRDVAAPTPAALRVTIDTHPDGPWLSVTGVARLAGVKASTVRSYLARHQMPRPDDCSGDRPRWRRQTITNWLQQRRTAGHNDVR